MNYYFCIPYINLFVFCSSIVYNKAPNVYYLLQNVNGDKDFKFPKDSKMPFVCVPFNLIKAFSIGYMSNCKINYVKRQMKNYF